MNSVLIFPGQGAQIVGMGKDLAEAFAEAREVFQEVDDAVDFPLSRLMWEGPEDELTLTSNAQPAIVAHSLAVHRVLGDRLTPVAMAGHSVGEYSAYAAAGTFTVADAARLVRRRGELMLEAGTLRPGTLTAVVGLETSVVQRICEEVSNDHQRVVAANLNTPEQTVLSGDVVAVEAAGAACSKAGAKRVLPLKVSGAFHSPLMEPVVEPFRECLDAIVFHDPAVPIMSSALASPVTTAAAARAILDRQLAEPVRWVDCMRACRDHAGPSATFVELGAGRVLTGLMRRIDRSVACANFGTVSDIEALLEAAS